MNNNWVSLRTLQSTLAWLAKYRLTASVEATPCEFTAEHRLSEIKQTLTLYRSHSDFAELVADGDRLRDTGQYAAAERAYSQALTHFPMHAGYRVQLAHMLKDQGKYEAAVVHYHFALGLGAPLNDVEDHILFAASKLDVQMARQHPERIHSAWVAAAQGNDIWAFPPIQADFEQFGRLLWGDLGPLTHSFMRHHLLQCTTRKALLLSLLDTSETVARNRSFFVMVGQRTTDNGSPRRSDRA